MDTFFLITEIVLGISLVVLVVMQAKGSGLGSTFGGDTGFYGTKRGAEKVLFVLTIGVSVLFLLTALISVILK